jgi:hypothetical protein
MSIVWCIFDIYDALGVDSAPVFRWFSCHKPLENHLSSAFPTKIFHAFLTSPMCSTCFANPIIPHMVNCKILNRKLTSYLITVIGYDDVASFRIADLPLMPLGLCDTAHSSFISWHAIHGIRGMLQTVICIYITTGYTVSHTLRARHSNVSTGNFTAVCEKVGEIIHMCFNKFTKTINIYHKFKVPMIK